MSSNDRYCGWRAPGAELQRFDMSEEEDEEDRQEAEEEEVEYDDQSMPELVLGPPQQRPWWYLDNVVTDF